MVIEVVMNIQFKYRGNGRYPYEWYYSPQGDEFRSVFAWCYTTYGPTGDRWHTHGGWIKFKEESDATLFTLKWS